MPPLPVFVFVVGTGTLGAEIAAVRLLAPYFGASTVVWANTIGVVLVALSIGYWLGGRFADRHPDGRSLCLLTLVAAVLLALVPFAADPFLDLAVSALDSVSAGAFVGSLIGVLGLLAVPILLLGAVSPVGHPAGGEHRRGGGRGGGPAVRALHGGQPGGHAAVGAAADPGRGHPPHLPDLRPGHRRGGRDRAAARVALRRGAGGHRPGHAHPRGHAQGPDRTRAAG